jgi:hypothetical protein
MNKEKISNVNNENPPINQENQFSSESRYLKIELIEAFERGDFAHFSREAKDVLYKKIILGESLSGQEQKIFDAAVARWWGENFRSPFSDKEKRREKILSRIQSTIKEFGVRQDLLHQLLKDLISGDSQRIQEIKQRYISQYPDKLETIEVLFGLKDFLDNQNSIQNSDKKLDSEDVKKIFIELAEYYFLLTHFVLLKSGDRAFMNLFWLVMEEIAAQNNQSEKNFKTIKNSVLSQVAAYKILEKLGKNPILSRPSDDAFLGVDLWADNGKIGFQVKGGKKGVPALVNANKSYEIIFFQENQNPQENQNSQENQRIKGSQKDFLLEETFNLRQKLRQESKKLKSQNPLYILFIPYRFFDEITGDPDPKLINFFQEKLEAFGETSS